MKLEELSYDRVTEIYKRGKFKYVDSKYSSSCIDPKIIGEYSKDLKSKGYTFRGIGSWGDDICQMYQRGDDVVFLEFEYYEGCLSYINVLRMLKPNYYTNSCVVGVIK